MEIDLRNDGLQPLPLGASSFPALRKFGQIYVDKTDLVFSLAKNKGRFLFTRPRRFGKSLLLSTFESLFRFGLRDFKGLKIEALWREPKTYPVVRLDFARVKPENQRRPFSEALDDFLEGQFSLIGFEKKGSSPLLEQLDLFLRKFEDSSLVVLIDEYDAPLPSSLGNPVLFEEVRKRLSDFYSILGANDRVFRFLFITGIAQFTKGALFSGLPTLSDISLEPEFGTLVGFTKHEVEHSFKDYVEQASSVLGTDKGSLLEGLEENYGGFCFETTCAKKVLAPWSVLSFFREPGIGFLNYWFKSGGSPSILLKYLKSPTLRHPEEFGKSKTLPLSTLTGASDAAVLSDLALLTQTGYFTLKKVREETAWVGFPNLEVRKSMARLYTEQILGGKTLAQAGGEDVAQRLADGKPEALYELLNTIFLSVDWQNYPVNSERRLRGILLILLTAAGLRPSDKEGSGLEVEIGVRLRIFGLKFVRQKEEAQKALKEALDEFEKGKYEKPSSEKEVLRMVLVFSEEDRQFVKWAFVE